MRANPPAGRRTARRCASRPSEARTNEPFAPPHRGGRRRRERYKPLPPTESPPRYLAKPGRASGLGRNVSGNPEATLGQPRQLSQPWRSSPLRDNPTGAILCAINRQSRVRGLDRARQLTEDRWRVDAARRNGWPTVTWTSTGYELAVCSDRRSSRASPRRCRRSCSSPPIGMRFCGARGSRNSLLACGGRTSWLALARAIT